jgi:signal transduction histidine kinase
MKKSLLPIISIGSVLLFLSFNALSAEGGATREDATKMVKAGVAAIKADGADKIYAEINNKEKKWIKEDLYLVVFGLDGKNLAHGANAKQVGLDLIDRKDIDGKLFIRERIDMAKAKPSGFWQDYKFTNPESKKIEPKEMYCEKLAETIVCGGIYK